MILLHDLPLKFAFLPINVSLWVLYNQVYKSLIGNYRFLNSNNIRPGYKAGTHSARIVGYSVLRNDKCWFIIPAQPAKKIILGLLTRKLTNLSGDITKHTPAATNNKQRKSIKTVFHLLIPISIDSKFCIVLNLKLSRLRQQFSAGLLFHIAVLNLNVLFN